jgi:hypothetical protein
MALASRHIHRQEVHGVSMESLPHIIIGSLLRQISGDCVLGAMFTRNLAENYHSNNFRNL